MSPELFGVAGPGADWARTIAVQDRRCGLRAIIVLHSLARGPAFGGVRRFAYANEEAGLRDARALAEAMSLKCALAGLAAGGGKTIIFDHPGLAVDVAYASLGRAIEELGGSYVCGPDIGTGPEQLAALRQGTRWVNPALNDASRSTALGVLAGLRGLVRVVFGGEALAGRRYVIEGLGGVGLALAAALVEAGGSVAGWDPSAGARARARALGVELLEQTQLPITPCDVFMPCALGGSLTRSSCERGPWRAVCGSANNQFADPAAAEILHMRGIAWAPDFVVNAGAVIEGVVSVEGGALGLGEGGDASPRDERALETRVRPRIDAIEGRCVELLERARSEGESPWRVALAAAHAALAER